jgi:hypothetical protein
MGVVVLEGLILVEYDFGFDVCLASFLVDN